MRDLAVLFLHLLTTVARLAGPGGARSVVAEPGTDPGCGHANVSSYRWQPHCRGGVSDADRGVTCVRRSPPGTSGTRDVSTD